MKLFKFIPLARACNITLVKLFVVSVYHLLTANYISTWADNIHPSVNLQLKLHQATLSVDQCTYIPLATCASIGTDKILSLYDLPLTNLHQPEQITFYQSSIPGQHYLVKLSVMSHRLLTFICISAWSDDIHLSVSL